jgi:hypothetical protein
LTKSRLGADEKKEKSPAFDLSYINSQSLRSSDAQEASLQLECAESLSIHHKKQHSSSMVPESATKISPIVKSKNLLKKTTQEIFTRDLPEQPGPYRTQSVLIMSPDKSTSPINALSQLDPNSSLRL